MAKDINSKDTGNIEDADNDDLPVGRVLNRREMLALLGSAGALVVAARFPKSSDAMPMSGIVAQTTPACVARPELTEGPYFVDEKLNRSDIRSDPSDGTVRQGTPLVLTFRVSQINNSCLPLAGATVDIWHCDALGVYSDVVDRGFSTVGKKFLRGSQVTDANGAAQFTTIYPGWYQGRAVHIHFKIRTDPSSEAGYEFTSQLFFNEAVTDQVYTQQPYANKGQRTLKNEGDGIYRNGGNQLLIAPTKSGQGYAATFDVGLQVPGGATGGTGTNSYTFKETGITVSGAFLTAWQGGRLFEDSLYINGYPITAVRSEVSPTDGKSYQTQWFERARYELHTGNQPPNNVLLGLLGATSVAGRLTETPFKAITNPGGGLQWFSQTGHTLGDSSEGGKAIASFWTRLGGLAQFGYPLSQPFSEVNKGDGKSYLVQYFERQRFEYHPENKGTKYEVLLGRLGAEQVKR